MHRELVFIEPPPGVGAEPGGDARPGEHVAWSRLMLEAGAILRLSEAEAAAVLEAVGQPGDEVPPEGIDRALYGGGLSGLAVERAGVRDWLEQASLRDGFRAR